MASPEPVTKKAIADPLPYIIVFAIMVLVALGVLTWTLSVWYKTSQCAVYPNVWCSNNWTCNNSCAGTTGFNSCFTDYGTGTTGLALCLMGPDSTQGQLCFQMPTGGTGDDVSCDCIPEIQKAQNCFSQCAQDFKSMGASTQCCCCPGTDGCPWSEDNVPSACGYIKGQPCVQQPSS